MRLAGRLAGFALVVAAAFALALVAGAAIDPDVGEPAGHGEDERAQATADDAHEAAGPDSAGAPLPGLAVAADGLRLVPDSTSLPPGDRARFRFRVVDADGATVLDFEREHERRMHLIVVRRDFAGFQHVHPTQRPDGTWEARLDLDRPGVYRAFADFATAAGPATLATDVFVAGAFEVEPLARPSPRASAGDGYVVELDSDPPSAGGVTELRFTVNRGGRELRSVEPYLGAGGHLVALREHDLAFLHTHPLSAGGSAPVEFGVEYPSAGRYRLFLQFRHRGEVRTAAFTQEVPDPGAGLAGTGAGTAGEGEHG